MMNLALSAALFLVAGGETEKPTRARVTVHMPRGATLYVDNVPSPDRSETVSFETAPLRPGVRYFHVLRAAVAGAANSASKRISFQAGDEIDVDLRGSGSAGAGLTSSNKDTNASVRNSSSQASIRRPAGPAPEHVLAKIGSDGRLVVLDVVTEFVPESRMRTFKDKSGKERVETYTVMAPKRVEVKSVYDLKEIKVFRADGRKVDPASLGEVLDRETPALTSSDGQMVDAFYLQVVDPATLILILPPPPAPMEIAPKAAAPKTAE